MIKFLNDIRNAEKPISNNRKIINTIAVLFLGIALGTFSKFLDFRQAELPSVLMAIDGALDVHNFLGRFAIWVLIALCISIYSNSAIRASINVFAFFIGMVASYYLYSNYIAGFFPRSYAVIWFGFTAVSPSNTIPNTGISLPFFSSGGTSLMMLLGEMGIVLSVSRGES